MKPTGASLLMIAKNDTTGSALQSRSCSCAEERFLGGCGYDLGRDGPGEVIAGIGGSLEIRRGGSFALCTDT